MAKPGVTYFINTDKFVKVLSDKLAMRVATNIREISKSIVASPWNQHAGFATGDLADSIRVEGIAVNQYEVIAGGVMGKKNKKLIAYALAQEFGRLDLINYRYRPYMRPGAVKAAMPDQVKKALTSAVNAAIMQSTVKTVINL